MTVLIASQTAAIISFIVCQTSAAIFLTSSQCVINSAPTAIIAPMINTIGFAAKNAKKLPKAGTTVPLIKPINEPITLPILPTIPITLPTALIIVPIVIRRGDATATTPNIIAIVVLTGSDKLLNLLASSPITPAILDMIGANAPPNSIAAFFKLFIATCILCAPVLFILSIALDAAPVLFPISTSVLL